MRAFRLLCLIVLLMPLILSVTAQGNDEEGFRRFSSFDEAVFGAAYAYIGIMGYSLVGILTNDDFDLETTSHLGLSSAAFVGFLVGSLEWTELINTTISKEVLYNAQSGAFLGALSSYGLLHALSAYDLNFYARAVLITLSTGIGAAAMLALTSNKDNYGRAGSLGKLSLTPSFNGTRQQLVPTMNLFRYSFR